MRQKISISLEDSMLEDIDAARPPISRSAYIQMAIFEKLERDKRKV